MPIYDLYCPVSACGYEIQDRILNVDEDNGECPECGEGLKRFCGCKSFKLVYNNKTDICDWEGNTTQYYRHYNEAKERGENVKLPED